MSEQTANDPAAQAALADLAAELGQVGQEMTAALADLRPPFSQLVETQRRSSFPLRRAAFVLAAGGATGAQERQKRIDLAAAIEVLRLALAVHTQLLSPAPLDAAAPAAPPSGPPAPLDRSLLGSTVLAGDYCFSRAAALAARTDSPVVVDIFAHALQRVSEGTLRGLFRAGEGAGERAGEDGGGSFAVERELCLAGVLAAGELAGIDAAAREADRAAALLLLEADPGRGDQRRELPASLPAGWPVGVAAARRPRWLALAEWLWSES